MYINVCMYLIAFLSCVSHMVSNYLDSYQHSYNFNMVIPNELICHTIYAMSMGHKLYQTLIYYIKYMIYQIHIFH